LRKSVLAREVGTAALEVCSSSRSVTASWVLLPFMVTVVVVGECGAKGLSGEAAIKMLDLFDGAC
jgi:hypothetical protein